MKNIFIAEIIKYIHLFLLFLVFVGFILPCKYLPHYIFLIILILLDWNDFDGMCILTRLEHYFRTGEWDMKPAIQGGPEFFRPYINSIFNLNLTREGASRLNYFSFISVMGFAMIRYIYNCKC